MCLLRQGQRHCPHRRDRRLSCGASCFHDDRLFTAESSKTGKETPTRDHMVLKGQVGRGPAGTLQFPGTPLAKPMGSFQSNVLLYFLRCTGILFLLSQCQISCKKYLSYKDFTFFPNILSTSLTVYLPDVLTTGRIKQYVSPKISKGQQFCPFWHSQSGLPLEEHE